MLEFCFKNFGCGYNLRWGISAVELSQEVGIPHQTLSRWVKEYANFRGNGGVMMKGKRPEDWTAEKKLKAIVEYENLDEEQRGKYLRGHWIDNALYGDPLCLQ